MAWEQPSKENELYKAYRESGRFGQDSKFSDHAKWILARILVEDPKERPSILQLKVIINACDRFGVEVAATPDFFGMGIESADHKS